MYVHICKVNLAVSTTFHLHLGDLEQELILTTKMPKATVGGLSPSKGYILKIFELTDSGPVLLARREFVSKSSCKQTGVDVGGRPLCSELMIWPCDLRHFACEVLGSCFLFLTLLLTSHEVGRFRKYINPPKPQAPAPTLGWCPNSQSLLSLQLRI